MLLLLPPLLLTVRQLQPEHLHLQTRRRVSTDGLRRRRLSIAASLNLDDVRADDDDVTNVEEEEDDRRHLLPHLRGGGGTAHVLWSWYSARLAARPLVTKGVTSGCVSALGDALAQTTAAAAVFDVKRCLSFALVGAFYFAPFLNGWYALFSRVERRALQRGLTRPQAIVLIWLTNMTFGALIANTGFFYAISLAKALLGGTASPLTDATLAVQAKLGAVMLANYAVWPIPSLINLSLVPLEYRVLFTNCVAVFWKFALSMITQKAA